MMTDRPILLSRLALLMLYSVVHAGFALVSLTTAMLGAAYPATPPASEALPTAAASKSKKGTELELPAAVAATRQVILDAVDSDRLEDLKYAVDLNEIKPELGAEAVPDPIAFWRQHSVDGTGHDILQAIATLFERPPAVLPLGQDPENTKLFVWPAFADRGFDAFTPEDTTYLQRLEGPAKAAQMRALGRYTGWRLIIGADGVWHVFRRYD
jgi:hypothetical protein